uniref:Uncharacterized protein n=1 Tax=Myotis lucifugus TaxID=59463 RepID=G1Q258_MYOLU
LLRSTPCTTATLQSALLHSRTPQPVGICRGSVSQSFEEKKFVDINCDFFQSQLSPLKGENLLFTRKFLFYQKNKSTHSPSKDVLSGSVQYLPELDDEESQETDPAEAFPVHLDLTTNPQGEPLNVSFLFYGPMIKKLFVLPFPKEEQRFAECPGNASMSNPIVLPP